MLEQVRRYFSTIFLGLSFLCIGSVHAQSDKYLKVNLDISAQIVNMKHSAVVESGREATIYKKLDDGSTAKLKYTADNRGPIGSFKETVGLKGSIYIPDDATDEWKLLRNFEMVVAKGGSGIMEYSSKEANNPGQISISFSAEGVNEDQIISKYGKIPEPRSCPGFSPNEILSGLSTLNNVPGCCDEYCGDRYIYCCQVFFCCDGSASVPCCCITPM
ncbi:MAG: hypothetical protein QM772_03955 [Ottowia sp.]|uniref:hypothetical protein n=1 Tax=Ottowia sp. TaxID=1898956 RepID=UPI0039E2177D